MRLFTFPDPKLLYVRGVSPELEITGGQGIRAIIDLGQSVPQGSQLLVEGNIAELGGTAQAFFTTDCYDLSNTLTATGSFSETITLAAGPTDSVDLRATSFTTGKLTALTIDLVE